MSRRNHSAHDLASLRIDLFGETAKTSSTPVFGRKARRRRTVDKRGNVLATAPFLKRKRNTVEMGNVIQGEPEEPTVSDVKDGSLESGPARKKRHTYYPGVLPYLDISGGASGAVYHLENEQPTADLLKRIHRFSCEYYSDRRMLYDASRGPREPDHRSNSKRLKNKGDALVTELEPVSTADTLRSMDEVGGHRDGETETAMERTTDKSLHKNMFRAFDGSALITIGMLLQAHIKGFLQQPPVDPNKWDKILFEQDQKQKKQNEWKMMRSKPRKGRPQLTNKTVEERSASGSGGDNVETDNDDDDNDNENHGTDEEGSLDGEEYEEYEQVVVVDHDSSGASSHSRTR